MQFEYSARAVARNDTPKHITLYLHSRKEVCTTGEGGVVACLWNRKVPQVPLREGLRVTNGPFAVDRAVEGKLYHLRNGQCSHPEMGTNTKQLPVPSGVLTEYEYLTCRRIESLATTRHSWTSTCTGGSACDFWEWPGRTWHRIHIDYAGPFEGRMILIVVDPHSKYIDAHVVSAATTSATLTKLRQTLQFWGCQVR